MPVHVVVHDSTRARRNSQPKGEFCISSGNEASSSDGTKAGKGAEIACERSAGAQRDAEAGGTQAREIAERTTAPET